MSTALVLTTTPIMLTLGYFLVCRFWPYTNCRRCHGTGTCRAPIGRARRLCPRCEATGLRLRAGRHALNYLTRLYRTSRF